MKELEKIEKIENIDQETTDQIMNERILVIDGLTQTTTIKAVE